MRELSLFTGAGGGLLATYLLGWQPVGYVEFNDYCQRIISARIKDGFLPEAPIFGDIRAFIDQGYARKYRGMVDVITGGFPCQPFSVAGKQAAADDPRNMWPSTIECIRQVRPRYCLLENVPGLLAGSHGYFGTILRELSESGYSAKWKVISAAELGAPHKRDRLWITCTNTENAGLERSEPTGTTCANGRPSELCQEMANADKQHDDSRGHGTGQIQLEESTALQRSIKICNANDKPGLQTVVQGIDTERESWDTWEKPACIDGRKSPGNDWWQTKPGLGRVVDGVAHRVDRLKAIGNGQVPAVVRAAWEILA